MARDCAGSCEQTAPDEIYNLAAQSHVRVSFDQAERAAWYMRSFAPEEM